MDNLILSLGNLNIFVNAVIITAGITVCFFMTKKLLRGGDAVTVFCALALVLSLIICRFLNWYVSIGQYESFISAFTDYSTGSFCLPGMLLGTLAAAGITWLLGYVKRPGRLLDGIAPGLCIVAAAVRLGALFTKTCYGKKNVTSALLQKLPITVALTGDAGNTYYRFNTALVEALLLLALAALLLVLFKRFGKAAVHEPCGTRGNIWRLFLCFYGVIEIIMEATRRDAQNIYFRYLVGLNQFSNFISLAQVAAMLCIIYVFVYYIVKASRIYGFGKEQIVHLILFVIALAGIGYLGEYCLQRHDFKAVSYISMVISGAGMSYIVWRLYESCLRD